MILDVGAGKQRCVCSSELIGQEVRLTPCPCPALGRGESFVKVERELRRAFV